MSESKRKVSVSVWEKESDALQYKMVDKGVGLFHQWGVDYEEFESGAGNFTVAIVEMPDGSILKPMPEHIKFLDAPNA